MYRLPILITALLWSFSGCSSMQVQKTPTADLRPLHQNRVAVIPFYNYTQTPMAGYSAASIACTLLQSHGYRAKAIGLHPKSGDLLDENMPDRMQLIAKLQKEGYPFILTGEVTEWRYKTGIDAEPVVGITVKIIDSASRHVLYSATGSRASLSQSSLALSAQKILNRLLPE